MPLTASWVRSIFEPLSRGEWQGFIAHVADNVDWTVVNAHAKTMPVAGRYDKQSFIAAFSPLNACFPKPLAPSLVNLTMGTDGKTFVAELRAIASANNGYHFDNSYAWVCETDGADTPTIKVVRAYLDSAMVRDVMDENAPEA